jgi:hypothetical protein
MHKQPIKQQLDATVKWSVYGFQLIASIQKKREFSYTNMLLPHNSNEFDYVEATELLPHTSHEFDDAEATEKRG